MAYDPVKAHEYYEKYRKKGLKKGRKKGRKKTTSSKIKKQSLLGLSTSDLNDAGKMNWAMAKKDLQDQMNAELIKAATPEQRAEITKDYQNKALKALQDMKKDPSFAQAKSSKSSKSGSKSGNKNSSKSGSKSSGSASNKSNKSSKSSKSKGAKTATAKKTASAKAISYGSASTAARTVSNEEFTKIKEMAEQIEQLKAQIAVMPVEQKTRLKNSIQTMIGKLKKRKKNG